MLSIGESYKKMYDNLNTAQNVPAVEIKALIACFTSRERQRWLKIHAPSLSGGVVVGALVGICLKATEVKYSGSWF